ncbi:hypothetical protein F751_0024 [Auxenochlorella protothecoides]|uniref:Uncharacterized protein n=1 Tax=Auxenochlorella protothecoides TaxID=3075 RepID=A0A087S9I3_AUXPR|nr:hypothetical protein F751_0024 [Auxenochlorella protothecoides]KFM22387.1 hypothetical protein F751_0024 [Auxenochlorella protothecoides]
MVGVAGPPVGKGGRLTGRPLWARHQASKPSWWAYRLGTHPMPQSLDDLHNREPRAESLTRKWLWVPPTRYR